MVEGVGDGHLDVLGEHDRRALVHHLGATTLTDDPNDALARWVTIGVTYARSLPAKTRG
jgi:hypothetical protein